MPVFWGELGPAGSRLRLLRRARRARRLLADPQPHDARLRGARRRLQPGGCRVRRHQRARSTYPRDGDLGRVRGARGRARHARLPLPLRRLDIPVTQVGFLGIAVALLGRNTAIGTGSARSSSAGCSLARRTGSTRTSSTRARRQPDLHDPGPDRAVRRRRRPHPLHLEYAAEAAAEAPAREAAAHDALGGSSTTR